MKGEGLTNMADCSLLAKLTLMPGCRPWDTPPPVSTEQPYTFNIPGVVNGPPVPFRPEDTAPSTEFSFPQMVVSTVSKVSANASRMFSSTTGAAVNQSNAPLAWYDITGRISQATSNVNDALQSTLIKVIILVVMVGVIALFGMSFVQAKGAQLAK